MNTIISFSGTLIGIIPFNGGVVVASDSRVTATSGQVFDGEKKIIRPDNLPTTAFVVTGAHMAVWVPNSFDGDLSAYLREYVAMYDAVASVKAYLEGLADYRQLDLAAMADRSRTEVLEFGQTDEGRSWLKSFAGRTMFTVNIANHDQSSGQSRIDYYRVDVSHDLQPIAAGIRRDPYSPNSPSTIFSAGQIDYFEQVVRHVGPLTAEFLVFGHPGRTVRGVTREEAIRVARNFIDATSYAARFIPPPANLGGIGGETLVEVLE